MTTLSVLYDGQGVCGLRASGHAGYAQSGSDIVCAAVSTLVTTCANALENVAKVLPVVTQNEKAAEIAVSLPAELAPTQRHDAQIILQTTLQGFMDIAAHYPKYLHIIDGRNQSC